MDVVIENLNGKTALITGGSRGIGRGCAEVLAQLGTNVVINYKANDKAAQETYVLIKNRGGRITVVAADVSNEDDVKNLIRVAEKTFGLIHILVNSAGISYPCSYEKTTLEDWDKILSNNLRSAFMVTQAVIPGMMSAKWGRIINLSSTAASTGYRPLGPAYTASKAGILGLTRYYAAALAKDGITSNAIAPSMVDTEMAKRDLKADPAAWPLGRFATVEEVSSVVKMLVFNDYITGQTIYVNGGRYST